MDVKDLKEAVRAWLRDKPGPITEKAKELDVSYFWLQRFLKGEIENIGTDRLQFLVERMRADRTATRRAAGLEPRPAA